MSGSSSNFFVRVICLTTLAGFLSPFGSHAQEIVNVDFNVHGSKVEITYDITACSGNENYDVSVFLGHEGDLVKLSRGLSGDLEHVACGSWNKIVWDVLRDRDELKGPVYFTVKILRTNVVTEDYPIADESLDERPAGAVPYGEADSNPPPEATYRPHESISFPPFGIIQLGAWIAFEQARAAVLSRGRPTIIFQKRQTPAGPQRKRGR